MSRRYSLPFFFLSVLLPSTAALAQCGVGEVQVTIAITTDDYGYETYWQFVPNGSDCGTGTIFEGGNLTVGCAGGGLQNQEPSGYGSAQTFIEGPWCLPEGALYDIYMVDDWGDSQAGVEVFVDGVSAAQFGVGEGPLNVYTFAAQGPVARDMSVDELTTSIYAQVNGPVKVRGMVKSLGSDPVNTFDITYTVDGGAPVTMSVSGVTLNAGDSYEFVHDTPWFPTSVGSATLNVTVSNINGLDDLNAFNDQLSSQHVISPEIPDLMVNYLAAVPLVAHVANSDQDLLVPRDLAFHPEGQRNELWVINKETEGTGGSTVTFFHPGEVDQTFEWRQDVNAWHFMSLPTALAMGDNNCFATCPGVFDANHQGSGDPFTGPTLWSADTAVYCRFYGGLGSHLDMLHVDPNSQGIAHEFWNRYWVVDGYRGDIVMNDFRKDHGPGNDYHGDAIIKRYADFSITKDPNDHIVSHDVLDKRNGWLYVVDHGGQRVMRLNTNTGTENGPGVYGPWESYVDYSMVTGYDWNMVVSEGLVEPAGIEIIGDHLLVSDHANGDIVIYDVSTGTGTELGRIHTGAAGLMGITIGPDGHIWGVNATTHELLRIDPQDPTIVGSVQQESLACYPNPANTQVVVELPKAPAAGAHYVLRDASGRSVDGGRINGMVNALSVERLTPGTYMLEIQDGADLRSMRIDVVH